MYVQICENLIFFFVRHVTQLSTNQVITQTSKDIARLTVLMRRGDKQQKLQIEKLTTDFKDAVQRYSDMQKVKDITSVICIICMSLSNVALFCNKKCCSQLQQK